MNTETENTEQQQLREMRSLITKKLYEALTDGQPAKASMIQTAASWLRTVGAVEDPDDRLKPPPGAASMYGRLPTFPDDAEGRRKLADAVDAAIQAQGDDEDGESDDF